MPPDQAIPMETIMSSNEASELLKEAIATAKGGPAVYLAARQDLRLKGHLGTTQSGKLTHIGKRLSEEGLANIGIYLTGKYGIQPSRWELYSGLVAAAASIPALPRKSSTSKFTDTYLKRVQVWLEMNETIANETVTTRAIAGVVDPQGLKARPRATEMKIAAALKSLGYSSSRVSVDGKRVYKWTKPLPAQL